MLKQAYTSKEIRTQAEPEEAEEDLGPCAATVFPAKPVAALTIKHRNKPWESFQYRHIGARSTYEPTRFMVEFVGDEEKWRIVVTGRNLEKIYRNVIHQRLEWIKEAERDFAPDKEPVILTIRAEPVEEEKARRGREE